MVTNKRRGYEFEREIVNFWKNAGIKVKRVLASGAFKHYGENLSGDIRLNGLKVECKRRKNGTGFAMLYNWFTQDAADLLCVKADRKGALYILPQSLMLKLAKDAGWEIETDIEGVKEDDE